MRQSTEEQTVLSNMKQVTDFLETGFCSAL